MPDRFVPGFDGTPNAPRLDSMLINDALATVFRTDAHFAPYYVADRDGNVLPMRMDKLPTPAAPLGPLAVLRANGFDVLCTGIVLDVDAPTHIKQARMVESWSREILTRLPDTEPAGFYFTRGGFRLLWAYEHPVSAEHHENAVMQYLRRVKDYGIDADPKCKDWTRLFRLPNVCREDGKRPNVTYSESRSISIPPRRPVTPPAVITDSTGKVRASPKRETKVPPEERIAAAREWLQTAPISIAGQGGDQTAFLVAQMLVRGASLDDADAMMLMREWNARCLPPWDENRLEYKIAQARDHGHIEWNSLIWARAFRGGATQAQTIGVERWSQAYAAKLTLDALQSRYGEIIADDGEFWRYDESAGVWKTINKTEIAHVVIAFDGTPLEKGDVKVDHAMIQGVIKIAYMNAERKEFFKNAAPGIAFTNGRYVIGHGLQPHSKDARLRASVPYSYDPNAPAPMFIGALTMALDSDQIRLLQEFCGVCLAGGATKFQRVMLLEGFGNNGKSVILDVISALFPDDARTSIEPQLLDHGNTGPYWRAMLAGKLINIVSDLPNKSFEDTAGFKKAAVGDAINARKPGEMPFSYRAIAGQLFSANGLPQSIDLSDGFFRRWLILKFEKSIPKEKVIRDYAERVINNEMPGVAAWAIAGAEAAYKRGHYDEPESCKAETRRWKRASDPFRIFVEDEIARVVMVGAAIATKDLMRQAEMWAARNGLEKPAIQKLANALRAMGFEPGRDDSERKWERKRLIH